MSAGGEEPMHESDRELLIRLDERVRNAVTTMEQRDIYHKHEMDRVMGLISDMTASYTSSITNLTSGFATKGELASGSATAHAELTAFASVTQGRLDAFAGGVGRLERIVYGACGVMLLSVIGALVALVIKQPIG